MSGFLGAVMRSSCDPCSIWYGCQATLTVVQEDLARYNELWGE